MFKEGQQPPQEFHLELPPDYYAFFSVSEGASTKEINRAYKRLALKCHPDLFPGDKAAEEMFKIINEIHQTLSDPEKRKNYNESRRKKQVSQRQEQKLDLTDFIKTERAGDFIVGYYPDGQKCVINPTNKKRTRAFDHNVQITLRQGILIVKQGKKEFYVEPRMMMESGGFDEIRVENNRVVGINYSYSFLKKIQNRKSLEMV